MKKKKTILTLPPRPVSAESSFLSGGFHYELACIFGKRVPRVYVKGGKIVGTKDYFHDQYEDFLE